MHTLYRKKAESALAIRIQTEKISLAICFTDVECQEFSPRPASAGGIDRFLSMYAVLQIPQWQGPLMFRETGDE